MQRLCLSMWKPRCMGDIARRSLATVILLSHGISNISCPDRTSSRPNISHETNVCDAVVTENGRKQATSEVLDGNTELFGTASDAFKSIKQYSRVDRIPSLKIRRCLAPWGFNSPSRHHMILLFLNGLRVIKASLPQSPRD